MALKRVGLSSRREEPGRRREEGGGDGEDRKSTRLNSSHLRSSRMPSSA